MVYLDYSATTPVDPEVLKSFNKVSLEYIGNANSLHKLGKDSFHLMKACEEQILNLLQVNHSEIIFTSGASEANSLAIIGSVLYYKSRGNHIITTKLEHSSVLDSVSYLEELGYEVEYVDILNDGKIDFADLKKKIRETTILVSLNHVNSETGLIQNINLVGSYLKKFPKIIFHVDGTQAIGKIPVSLENVDLYSFSGHKIYGLKGIGGLIKNKKIMLKKMIRGGLSQTIYRSGTPCIALYASLSKALKLTLIDIDKKYEYVAYLNKKIQKELKDMDLVTINSNQNCIPHILNISIKNIKPETMLHALACEEIYISTKTACTKEEDISTSIFEWTKDKELASHSLRISLSPKTTEAEIDFFLKVFKQKILELTVRKGE